MATQLSTSPPYRLIRGCSLVRNRRAHGSYFLGTLDRVVAVTSPFELTALNDLARGINPLSLISPEIHGEVEGFIESLASHGFLNRNFAQISAPKRYFDQVADADMAVLHMRSRTSPELAQSEWIDNKSDGGSSTLVARSNYPVVLSGRSRVITLMYSMLLASGVSRVRFADRHMRPTIESLDIGFGAISPNDLGLNYYEQSELARRSISLFPIDPSMRHDFDLSTPIVVIHYGDCDPQELVEWSQQQVPHYVIHQPIGDEIVIGPLVIPGQSPCIRCLSLYEIDNFGYTRLERIPVTAEDELPAITAHFIAAIATSQILHFIDQRNESHSHISSRATGIGEVAYINFQRLTEPQVVAIARHPLCGCDR